MRRSRRLSVVLLLVSALVLSLGATSCGGGGGSDPDLVLIGFNVPNIAGVPLNQPLIFTFSNKIDPSSITPDTLRVVGSLGPNFDPPVVDGNLVTLLPRSPNNQDYSDAGLLPGIRYTVSLAVYPAPSTIRSLDGKPLLDAESFQFDTVPTPDFMEPRRPINHGLSPSQGGKSDDEGCLNNWDNSLPTSKQFGSDCINLPDDTCAGPRLICLKNEGAPEIILDECEPTHNDVDVGVGSSVVEGLVELPALRVRFNEPLDPVTVAPYNTDKFGLNVQLWWVGGTDRLPLPPLQVRTNRPLLNQSLDLTEVLLAAANEDPDGIPVGGVPQGTYLINITSAVTDLPGIPLDTAARPSPIIGGFQDIEDAVNGSGDVPPGYRIYFVTAVVPGSPTSIIESFTTNLSEWGSVDSDDTQPGVFTYTDLGVLGDPDDDLVRVRIPGSLTPSMESPEHTLASTRDGIGQSTTANWNGAFRMFGLDSLPVNTDRNDGVGLLKAVWQPYVGDGQDGNFTTSGGGGTTFFTTDPGAGASNDQDGIYEYESFNLQAGDTISVSGVQPLIILCRGDFTLDGTIEMNGAQGGPGLDTDGDVRYAHADSIPVAGAGGEPAPGGGIGGGGGDPLGADLGVGFPGGRFTTLFRTGLTPGGSGGFIDPTGGGGGGMGAAGDDGTLGDGTPVGNGGTAAGDAFLASLLAEFTPDRTYSPNANGSGGTGGGGGGMNDDNGNGTPENGDDGGGGGGGAGGGLYVIAGGTVTINGIVRVNGGAGGDTFGVADQEVDLGADGVAGGTGDDADSVTGISPGATPSGAGGPGGGGSGGTLYFMGRDGILIGAAAQLTAGGGDGGESGNASLLGGDGSEGVILLSSMGGTPITITGGALISPASPPAHEYQPTVHLASVGQSEWVDLSTPTAVFERFSWNSNFEALATLGLIQSLHYDAILEVQGAASLSPNPLLGAPVEAGDATVWTQINLNVSTENAVEYVSPAVSPIDGKRFFRWRWRFRLDADYPGTTQPLPALDNFTIEFER